MRFRETAERVRVMGGVRACALMRIWAITAIAGGLWWRIVRGVRRRSLLTRRVRWRGASGQGDLARPLRRCFSVYDANGRAYDPPFLGGFNVPRPQFADIDGDGDVDLFIQERSGELMLFENVGEPTRPEFVWRTDRYQDLPVGE